MPPDVWGTAPTVASAGSLTRIVAIGIAGWLTITTAGYVAAKTLKLSRITTSLARAAIPSVRRFLDRALATTVIVGTVSASPAVAAPPPIPVPVVVTVGVEESPASEHASRLEITAAKDYRVSPGDSFWTIAAARAPADITSFWLEMIELNLQTIRSGDPNLIFPGEILRLPVG